ncbi:hypothetical protein GCM10010306_088860 [Streptomyces umbrinus]|nr:hypothetical protein GCM10010306_088860 [Streptomyces umbrinus]
MDWTATAARAGMAVADLRTAGRPRMPGAAAPCCPDRYGAFVCRPPRYCPDPCRSALFRSGQFCANGPSGGPR